MIWVNEYKYRIWDYFQRDKFMQVFNPCTQTSHNSSTSFLNKNSTFKKWGKYIFCRKFHYSVTLKMHLYYWIWNQCENVKFDWRYHHAEFHRYRRTHCSQSRLTYCMVHYIKSREKKSVKKCPLSSEFNNNNRNQIIAITACTCVHLSQYTQQVC